MIKFFNHSRKRVFSSLTLMAFLAQLLTPTVSFALTSGPSQPEFSSFEPVATTDMVNPLMGDFNYNLPVLNVPGPNGGGYALSLSYHSGVGMEEDASWVGYGWTLNPGAINRGKKGFPDDYQERPIENINTTHNNVTIAGTKDVALDFLTLDNDVSALGVSMGTTIRYNNFTGFTGTRQFGISGYDGLVSVGYSKGSDGSSGFNFDVNPAALFSNKERKSLAKARRSKREAEKNKYDAIAKLHQGTIDFYTKTKEGRGLMNRSASRNGQFGSAISGLGSSLMGYALSDDQRPMSVSEYSGMAYSFRFNLGGTPTPLDIAVKAGIMGSYAVQNPHNTTYDANGYLYASFNGNTGYDDYSLEKESSYNKRDKYMSIPYSAADDFAVTGEGMNGAFKFRRNNINVVGPPDTKSLTDRIRGGFEVKLGLETGLGGSLGNTVQVLKTERWASENLNLPSDNNGSNEGVYLSYNGDLANNINFSNSESDAALSASFDYFPRGKDESHFPSDLRISQKNIDTQAKRAKRASYIGYHTNREMLEQSFLCYEKRSEIIDAAYRKEVFGSLIGEISTVNEEGNRYVYGLPAYSMNEVSMSYGVKSGGNGCSTPVNKTVHFDVSNSRKIGQIMNDPYASTYLITQITSPDYIDRTMDGPSQDDFGGWTNFSYTKEYGSSKNDVNASAWYEWRAPYNGLNYSKNSHSDVRDDMGSVASGKKEIYYLKDIETKTHIAKFILNDVSTEQRSDGLSAHDDNEFAANSTSAKGTKTQRYLKKIELYAKDPADPTKTIGKAIKTVHFAYAPASEELCKGLPASTNGGGKLTLKKVWFEYEGIVKSKISPYEFAYEYKKDYSKKPAGEAELSTDVIKYFKANGSVKQNYSTILTELGAVGNENPNYNTNAVDAWGYFAYNAKARNEKMVDWVYQGDRLETEAYDPAAWNLKTIVLPSGGQILVQYEEKDYCYVQNLPVGCLVKLKEANHATSKYTIDLSELGSLTDTEISDYITRLKEYFGVKPISAKNKEEFEKLPSQKMFYKILFKLTSDATDNVASCGMEYIKGYCKVKSINQVEIDTKKHIQFELANDGQHGITTPAEACRDFYGKMRNYLNINNDCNNPDKYDDEGKVSDLESLILDLLATPVAFVNDSKDQVPYGASAQYSYLRVPLPEKKSKRGGGLRVKRLMMYDAGFDKAGVDETLYGTEYIYQLEDGRSSGVAINEPVAEESALKHSLDKRLGQKWSQRMLSGDDLDEFEGPIGETLLPGPSVAHSRVVTKSIYLGTATTGFTVNEYHTVKDYPSYQIDNTGVDNNRREWLYVPAILVNIDIDNRWSAQGYSFVTNDMHGKPKYTARYGGDYKRNSVFDANLYSMAYKEEYNYFKPGEKVPVFKQDGSIAMEFLGREEDCIVESKAVIDHSEDFFLNGHTGIGWLAILVLPNFWISGSYSHTERKLKTVVTNRVIHYKSHLKSTVTTKDGITYVSENRAFDPMTGEPLITMTSDEYYGAEFGTDPLLPDYKEHQYLYSQYAIPARYINEYKNLGGKYINENFEITGINPASFIASGSNALAYSIGLGTTDASHFVKGDLVCLYSGAHYAYGYVSSIQGVSVNVLLTSIDHVGGNVSDLTNLRVLRSGYTNQLKAVAGEITAYSPAELLHKNTKPIADLLPKSPLNDVISNVLSASATVFSDEWPLTAYMYDHYNIDASGTSYNKFLTGEAGKWRLKSTYAYKASTSDAVTTASGRKTFTAGTFKYDKFKHDDLGANTSWIKGNTVKYYSPNGEALEEENAIDIPSAAKFGHSENVPLIVAANARFSNILFTGFEDKAGTGILSDKFSAHTGNQYLSIAAQSEYNGFGKVMSNDLISKGALVRWWSRVPVGQVANWQLKVNDMTNAQTTVLITPKVMTNTVAKVGEWTLYEARVTLAGVGTDKMLSFSLVNNTNFVAYLDDYRVQPVDAQATCYVYDNSNLRLLASFDDRHFAMIYQYDAEGKLVRKIIETEKGVKTVSETHYNVPQKLK